MIISKQLTMNQYKCDKCEFTSKYSSNVRRHEEEMHKESSEESDSDDEIEVESDPGNDETDTNEEDFPLGDVWPSMREEVDEDENILQVFKRKFLYNRSFENDAVVTAVIATMQKAQREDDMDMQEALDYAIEKRKYLIIRQAKNDKEEEASDSEDGAGNELVFNSTPAFPYSRI